MGEAGVFRENPRKKTNWKAFSNKRKSIQENSRLRGAIGNQKAKQADCRFFCGEKSERRDNHHHWFWSK